ncbi:ATP-binding protein [Sphingomonas sp. RIT328]|uniref:ATP-binding protein n=1 Tax=Sphingomonas sp. RIT328 TaxID=1470591 RepID=UPI00044E21D4|nr:ATP-binding protein [Sphingomonas sp. RIT328]EZP49938.1 hypothetical protein BW41_03263 [Sphingomonas sp. RIT328]
MKSSPDPYGVPPTPRHGDPRPVFGDRTRAVRAAAVTPFLKSNYIEHAPQRDVIDQLLDYSLSMLPLLGRPIDGRGLSEHSGAGKSRMIERLVETAATRRRDAGQSPNPYQIVCVELDKTTTIASFYRQVLFKLKDEHWNDTRSTTDDLEDRIVTLSRRLGVEALVGDEAQHLDRKTTNADQVTDRLKTFLNRGVLPLILIGDEKAKSFFAKNPTFAVRLGTPLALKPLDFARPGTDQKLFLKFCDALDTVLAASGIMDRVSGLGRPGIRTPLAQVSGGHVGRVCRLVGEAAQHALRRGSPVIEPHDLSVATRDYAIGLGWIARDPFSRRMR